MSPDSNNCRLNTVNIIVSMINVLLPAISWVLTNHSGEYNRSNVIVTAFCLILSCVILVWGFKKLASVMQSDQHLVNKLMIIWHIIAYFFIVTAILVSVFFISTPQMYEIS
jgi:hypothetical protein